MKTIELFSGTESFSKIAKELGHETFTVDSDLQFNPDLWVDLFEWNKEFLWRKVSGADIIWMSPPCTTFSMASGNTHWNKDRTPKTKEGVKAKKLLKLCWEIAEYCIENNKIFFIENPRARARWFLSWEYRNTAWYCQYGDSRAKPTDIWNNLRDWNPKECHNGNKDCHHEPAPRGSKTGTQGIKGARDRSIIPSELFKEIFTIIGGQK